MNSTHFMKTRAALLVVCTVTLFVVSTRAESGFAEVNGTRLWYESAGKGRAVVFVHGGGAEGAEKKSTLSALCASAASSALKSLPRLGA